MKGCWILLNAFVIFFYTDWDVGFVLHFVNVLYYNDLFLYAEPVLQFQQWIPLGLVYDYSNALVNSVC